MCMAVCRKLVIIVNKVLNMDIALTKTHRFAPEGFFWIIFIMDVCIFLGFTPPIHYHYKAWKSQDIFLKNISDCVQLKEDSHIHLGSLDGE